MSEFMHLCSQFVRLTMRLETDIFVAYGSCRAIRRYCELTMRPESPKQILKSRAATAGVWRLLWRRRGVKQRLFRMDVLLTKNSPNCSRITSSHQNRQTLESAYGYTMASLTSSMLSKVWLLHAGHAAESYTKHASADR